MPHGRTETRTMSTAIASMFRAMISKCPSHDPSRITETAQMAAPAMFQRVKAL